MFNKTTRNYVEQNNIQLLTDRGYTHPLLVTPDTVLDNSSLTNSDDDWSKLHSAARSPGEIINSLVKNWAFASQCCKQTPEWQAIGLGVVYALVNLTLKAYPARLYPENVH